MEDSLPVLVRLVSESGKQVKEYRIQLTKENQFLRRQLLLYKKIFQNSNLLKKIWPTRQLRKKDSTLYLGETRVEQEGKTGKERIFTAINPDGSKEEKTP